MSANNKSIKATIADQEFRRRGCFTKAGIKIDINKKIRTSKKALPGDLENRFEKREGISNRAERGLFFENRIDVCKSIKRPKKNAAEKVRKKDNAQPINQYNGTQFERSDVSKLWELYNQNNKPIDFRSFESRMQRTVFKNKVNTLLKAQ